MVTSHNSFNLRHRRGNCRGKKSFFNIFRATSLPWLLYVLQINESDILGTISVSRRGPRETTFISQAKLPALISRTPPPCTPLPTFVSFSVAASFVRDINENASYNGVGNKGGQISFPANDLSRAKEKVGRSQFIAALNRKEGQDEKVNNRSKKARDAGRKEISDTH